MSDFLERLNMTNIRFFTWNVVSMGVFVMPSFRPHHFLRQPWLLFHQQRQHRNSETVGLVRVLGHHPMRIR